MNLAIIVAISENDVIGDSGALPWHLPRDLAHFKKITTGHTIIMGRRTFESIGRPLPNRHNIVVTRNPSWSAEGAHVAHGLRPALELADRLAAPEEEAFIIGGAELYRRALPLARTLYLTRVHASVRGDTTLTIDLSDWRLVSREHANADERNEHDMTFETYTRAD